MGYNDIGDFFYAHGQLSDACKSYIRTRDYCTTSKHIVQMCMNVILVSIELGQFAHVSNYVSKAEQTPDSLDPIIVAKLHAATGLANLETKKYELAARKFKRGCLAASGRKWMPCIPVTTRDVEKLEHVSDNQMHFENFIAANRATFSFICSLDLFGT